MACGVQRGGEVDGGVIAGYARLLQDRLLDEESSTSALDQIREASSSALGLIDDLLELSLAEAGELRLEFERVDVGRPSKDL